MIITTTQDLAEVGNCGCACALPTCAAPRKECESIDAVAESTGEIKAADTTWKRYTIKNDIITLVQSLSEPGTAWTSSASDSTGYEWDRLFSGSVTGIDCTEWAATRADTCESTGSATLTFYDTPGDPPARGDRATELVKTRTNISGTNIPGSDPLEQYAPCTYLDTAVDTDHRDTPPTVVTTTSIGGSISTVYTRFVGMKSRGCYETPGGTILLKAHRGIESITLDREVAHLKDDLMPRYASLIYNGLWWAPERLALQTLIDHTQQMVNGVVRLKLYKGSVSVISRDSANTLFDQTIATFDDDGGAYNQADAGGFIKLNALRMRIAETARRKRAK